MTIYRGVGGVNREIKQQFRGVGSVNREIKEQYRNAGGVNREVFASDISLVLYDNGIEEIAKCGGWRPSSGNSGSAIVVRKNGSTLECISVPPGRNNCALFVTAKKVSLAGYNRLYFTVTTKKGDSRYSQGYCAQVGLTSLANPDWYTTDDGAGGIGRVAIAAIYVDSTPAYLDISNYNGEYYIYLGTNEGGNVILTRQLVISKVWLAK